MRGVPEWQKTKTEIARKLRPKNLGAKLWANWEAGLVFGMRREIKVERPVALAAPLDAVRQDDDRVRDPVPFAHQPRPRFDGGAWRRNTVVGGRVVVGQFRKADSERPPNALSWIL